MGTDISGDTPERRALRRQRRAEEDRAQGDFLDRWEQASDSNSLLVAKETIRLRDLEIKRLHSEIAGLEEELFASWCGCGV